MDSTDGQTGLQFDKATYTSAADPAAPPCENCRQSLGAEYWQWQTRMVCATCRSNLAALIEQSQSKKSFMRALLLGSGAAVGCGIAYAIFVALTDFQIALVTIGIAFLIAKIMRHCSAGVGGRKYQLLAVALTYVASAMGYAPAVLSGLKDDSPKEAAAASSAQAKAAATPATPAQPNTRAEPASAGQVALAFVFIFAITLAAPFLAATEAPIGLLIVFFGLWEAWKLSQGLPLTLEGPFRAAPRSPEPSST